jgi:hypothetical protein
LSNAGSIGGVASLTFTNVKDYPGTTAEPEPKLDGEDEGNLSKCLYIEVIVGGQTVAEGFLSELAAGGAIKLGSLPAGESITVTIVWSIDSEVGNEIMGDVVTFDILFSLEQAPA